MMMRGSPIRGAVRQVLTRHLSTGTKAGEGGKLWGGRFSGDTDPLMEKYNKSIDFDKV